MITPSKDVFGRMILSNRDRTIILIATAPKIWQSFMNDRIKVGFLNCLVDHNEQHLEVVEFVDEPTHYRLLSEWMLYECD